MFKGETLLFIEKSSMLLVGIISIYILYNILKTERKLLNFKLFYIKLKAQPYKYYFNRIETSGIYKDEGFTLMDNNDLCELNEQIKINYNLEERHVFCSKSEILF